MKFGRHTTCVRFLPEDGNSKFLHKLVNTYQTQRCLNIEYHIFAAVETSAFILAIYIFPEGKRADITLVEV
jgi:hypothetical protein